MGNPIKKYRKNRGLKQLDLALLLGTSEMMISNWERGARRAPEEMIRRLAKVFKINPQTLKREIVAYVEQRQKDLKRRLGA